MKISVISRDLDFARMLETELSWRSHVIVSENDADAVIVDADTCAEAYVNALYFGRGDRPAYAERFLARPFRMTELFEILEKNEDAPDTLMRDSIEIGLEKNNRITAGGRNILLSDAEYSLLALLLDRRGETVTKTEILSEIFPDADNGTNICEVYIHYLREKIDKTLDTNIIRTVRGKGYMIK